MISSTHILRAGCKINLFLEVTGKRNDGMHTVASLLLPLPVPCDALRVTISNAQGMNFACSLPQLHTEYTTLHRAYDLFCDACGCRPGIDVFLQKGIPLGAGLGGGSADAAVFLRFLNRHMAGKGMPSLDAASLRDLAARIGADVPFFLLDAPALASGIGEILQPVPSPVAGMFLVLACPPLHIATRWAYALWDERGKNAASEYFPLPPLTLSGDPDTKRVVHGTWLKNDFESVMFPEYPELYELKCFFFRHGAAAAVMSGTGSSMFGVFASQDHAEKTAALLRKTYGRVFCRRL